MSPKEKAEYLIKEYLEINEIRNHNHFNILVNKCVSITVDEMIRNTKDPVTKKYWKDVKHELKHC